MTEPAESILFDRSVYDLDAIKRAAYRLSGRVTIDISQTDTEVVCRLKLINPGESTDAVIADFKNEVLDQDLRSRIR